MSKSTVVLILTHLLNAVGAYLLGKNIFGHPADASSIQEAIGVILSLVSVGAGFFDGSVTIEAFQAAIKQLITFAGAFLLSSGKISNDMLQAILAIVTILGGTVYQWLSKKKSTMLASGTLSVGELKQIPKAA